MFLFKKQKNITIFFLLVVFFILDRFLKNIALKKEETVVLLKNFLNFSFFPNKNISFSLVVNNQFLFAIIFFLLLLIFFYLIFLFREINFKKKNLILEFFSYLAIFLGALSNFIDRLRFSYVVDYLDLAYFTVFNLADVLIVAACFFLVFLNFKKGN